MAGHLLIVIVLVSSTVLVSRDGLAGMIGTFGDSPPPPYAGGVGLGGGAW